jgi:putative restriction endonuclease
MTAPSLAERALRERIMNVLAERAVRNGGVVSRDELSAMRVGDRELRLIDQSRGIWNPSWLSATLSIVSSPGGPYNDTELKGGLLRYDYRAGTAQGDNRKLRAALELGVPLILLRKIETGVYVPVFPVYVVDDDQANHQFVVALDESLRFLSDPIHPTDDERRYADRIVRARLHQPEFRAKVIRAYATSCTVCSLRHAELLDAAHIVRDADDWGLPVIPNGLSLCKIHHAAYDANLMGVTPDYQVRINHEVLRETDGPMLKYGLQEMHGRNLLLPARVSDRPDPNRLAVRFDQFEAAS